jgi:MFS family permease
VAWLPAALYVFSIMMTSICKSYYQFVLAQGVLGGTTIGLAMAPAMAAPAQYFHKNRGAAMGIIIGGSSLGGVCFPIALGKMLYNPHLSFGWTVRICGFIILTVLTMSCSVIRARLPPRNGRFLLLSAFKEPSYIAIIGAAFLMIFGFFIPFFYLPSYGVAHGMSNELASYLVSILNGASFFGRIVPGILADRLGRLNMFCAAGITTGILIFCWPKTHTNASIIVFTVLYGFFSGAIISMMTVCLASSAKDPKNIGTYMGMGMCVISFAALIGPPVNGALVNHQGGFEHLSIFSGVLVLTGASFVLFAKHVSGKGIFGKI